MSYQEFLASKKHHIPNMGIDVNNVELHPSLFPFQRDVTRWALKKGRAAMWLDTGLGKTRSSLEWARALGVRTLIVAPLSVARQTVREGVKIGVTVHYTRSSEDLIDGINITNYEMVEHFDHAVFGAVVLDESSILKALTGKTRTKLIDMFQDTPYRLCCTATPAPNDYTELGNHAEFLGVCTTAEMMSMFFINANKQQTIVGMNGQVHERKGSNAGGQEWRLKHHAEGAFFEWLASWAISLTMPSDLGYDDDGFILPPLNIIPTFVDVDIQREGELFFQLHGITDRIRVRRDTIDARLEATKNLITNGGGNNQWIIWAGLEEESRKLTAAFADLGAVEVKGADSPEYKASTFERFQDGEFQILITKAKIGGFGMNFQNSANAVFFGINDSWETYYQAIRRQWRYGQPKPVNIYIVLSEAESPIYQNILRKDALNQRLRTKLIEAVRDYERGELNMQEVPTETDYKEDISSGKDWRMLLGDSCKRLAEIKENSVDLSIYSPPFADLFTYSPSERDLGNSHGWTEFFAHYAFIIREILRVTKPGRLTCVHTSDIPAMASRDGWIGIRDFPGEVIRAYEREGWVFVGRAFVQKNPQAQAIRTKSKALLFVQLRKDSADSRPALVDQILLFTRPGDNAVPVRPVDNGELDNETWIEWANGIWLGISESDTLSYSCARGGSDEKHICPLQLGTIERCIKLYSNPGEVVLSPFAGIGSEGYEAVRLGRKFIGIELKNSYYAEAVRNLQKAERLADNRTTALSEYL